MPSISTNAILLRRTDWGESSQLFTLYTERLGKAEVIGRGTKKIQSKLNGHLQYFVVINVLIARGRSIDQLAGAVIEETFFRPGTELQRILLGSFMIELVQQLTKPHQPDHRAPAFHRGRSR